MLASYDSPEWEEKNEEIQERRSLRVVPAGSETVLPDAVEVDLAAEEVVGFSEEESDPDDPVSTAAAVVAIVTDAANVVSMVDVCWTATLMPETFSEEVDLTLHADLVLDLETEDDLALHADFDLELVAPVELLNGAEVTTGPALIEEDEAATATTWTELDDATTAAEFEATTPAAELVATLAAVVYQ